MSDNRVSVERVIPASPQAIFDLLADPAMHPPLDGSGTVRASRRDNPSRLSLGAKFGMDMRVRSLAPYRISNEIVEFEEGRRIGWCHFGKHVWRYELEPAGEGTRVTETFDYSTARSPAVLRLLGYPRRNKRGMEETLANLERHFKERA